jgi:hypothetical protein
MARKGRDWPAHGLLHGLVQPHQNPNPFPGSLTASPCSAAAPSPSPRSAPILTPPHSSLPLSHSVTLSVSHPSLPHARRRGGPSQREDGERAACEAPPGRGQRARGTRSTSRARPVCARRSTSRASTRRPPPPPAPLLTSRRRRRLFASTWPRGSRQHLGPPGTQGAFGAAQQAVPGP